MPTQMITNDQIFRSNSRFDSSEIVTYLREVIKNTPFVLENVHGTSGIDFRTWKIDRPIIINSTSSPPSQITSSLFAVKANASVE